MNVKWQRGNFPTPNHEKLPPSVTSSSKQLCANINCKPGGGGGLRVLFVLLYFLHPSPSLPLSFSRYAPSRTPALPSCGCSTQLCSRQTIWCTLLMTDPTWPRHHLAATACCVCLFVCACEDRCMVTDDGMLCVALTTKAGGLVTQTLTSYSDCLSPFFCSLSGRNTAPILLDFNF